MNRRLFPLALSLALLAGCAPAPEPTPEPTPTPAAAVDFHTFLDAVNEKRRAVIEDGEPLDVSDWTPAFADQNTTFTDGEMELLLTPHGPEENLTMEQAREDVETAFTLLRTTYGAYEYFGGDQVFDGLREDALARLEEADPGLPLADVVAEALYTVLSPVVRDGHFAVGRRHLIEPYELNTYYVPGVYIDTPAGLSEDYIKPTIGPDGAITYGFFAMSKDGSELMTQDELAVMDGGKCIFMLRGVRPFLSDKYDLTRHPNYRYTADADPKNVFDMERYMKKQRVVVKPTDTFDVYEIDATT